MADAYLDIAAELGVKLIYTLGGFGVGHLVYAPRVFGATNREVLKAGLTEEGVIFERDEPGGGIVGAAGLLVGMGGMRGIDAVCLMGETSGYVVDPMSAASVLLVLSKLIAVPVDPTQLNDRAAEMEKVVQGLLENEKNQHDEELQLYRLIIELLLYPVQSGMTSGCSSFLCLESVCFISQCNPDYTLRKYTSLGESVCSQ